MIRIILWLIALLLCNDVGAITYHYQPGIGLELSWQADDRVGITTGKESYGEMEQLSFWISSTATALQNERYLYAVGYKLNTDVTYYSYYPYRWMEFFDARNIQCRYDQQTQDGNDNTAALSLCDYQIATTSFYNNTCTLAYTHIGGVLRVSFVAPSDMDIASLSLVPQSGEIATVASMNIINGEVNMEKYESALTLTTKNLNAKIGEEIVLYIACPPQDLSATPLSVIVAEQNGSQTTVAKVSGPNVKAGYVHDMDLSKATKAAKVMDADRLAPMQIPRASAPLPTAAISNPLARIEDFPLDNDYVCTSVASLESDKPKDNSYYTLQGTKAQNITKGNIYIYNGQKIVW